MNPSVVSLAADPGTRTVNVRQSGIQIQNLTIERPGIVDYLKSVTDDKKEMALVHAIEVGIVAIEARRASFQRRRAENRV